MLHDRLQAEFLDRAHLHTDAAPQIAGHDRPAALVDQFVLLDAAIPNFLFHQRPRRTALHADLADLVNTIVDGLIVHHWGVGRDHHYTGARAEVGRQQLAIGAQLAQAGL